MKRIINVIILVFLLFINSACNKETVTKNPETTIPTTDVSEIVTANPFIPLDYNLPYFKINSTTYQMSETIDVEVFGEELNAFVGIFDSLSEPGKGIPRKKIKVSSAGTYTFDLKAMNLDAGEYAICLYQNRTFYNYCYQEIILKGEDKTDYQITDAKIDIIQNGKKTTTQLTIFPSTADELTYKLYWCKDGLRLSNYTEIKRIKIKDALDGFQINLNDNLIMPNEANELEIAIIEGESKSFYLQMDDTLKLAESEYVYNFQVLTDIHANNDNEAWTSHFSSALLDVKCLAGNTSGIFTVGDNTDMGSQTHYQHLFSMIDNVFTDEKPPMYFTVGNHDYMYFMESVGGFTQAMNYFVDVTKMPNYYHAREVNGYKYIFLSSDEQTVAGSIYKEQMDWFKNEMKKVDKNQFAFVFLHQPLKDTTAGSLEDQDWYGVNNVAEEMKSVLADYPNVVLFTGHTHYSLDCYRASLLGHGENANFIHNGSVAYLWNDEYIEIPGSHGNFIEVYKDYIVIMGRDFYKRKWVSGSQQVIYLYE